MEEGAVVADDQTPQTFDGHQNQVVVGGDMNNPDQGVLSASIEQTSDVNEGIPTTAAVTPDGAEDKFPEIEGDNDTNNGTENEDAPSESDQTGEQTTKRKRRKRTHYQRHTTEQIQGMESFFKQYPHPDDRQRRDLARALGLDHLQVKFWFQNKRTQIKTQHERKENNQLRVENEKLRSDNFKMKHSIPSAACTKCGNAFGLGVSLTAHNLMLENKKIKEKIEEAKALAKSMASSLASSSSINQGTAQLGGQPNIPVAEGTARPINSLREMDKAVIKDLALSAMEEVIILARIGEPIWLPDFDRRTIVLNEQEYFKSFRKAITPKPLGYKSESSRDCLIVTLHASNIVDIFMDLNKWLAVFSGVVTKAMLVEQVAIGTEVIYNGALQVISAEFQVLSPAVATRDCVFARYCKKLSEASWAVIDVSVDTLLPGCSIARCQKRPSGCIIQAIANGTSQITWVEHVEVKDLLVHNIAKSIVCSGEAYNAKRWTSLLKRQCERLAGALGISSYPHHEEPNEIVLVHPQGKQNVLKLSERMVLTFCTGVTGTTNAHHWSSVSGNGVDEVRIMTRRFMDDPGRPGGLVLSASFSFWIPVVPKTVFDYLCNEKTRTQWDILCFGGAVKEIACIGNGTERSNCVSILRVLGQGTDQSNMLIFQETSSEPTASIIVYAPVDVLSANMIFMGGSPEHVQLLPSGFTILPCRAPSRDGRAHSGHGAGSLLTIAFQILADPDPFAKLAVGSLATVNSLVESVAQKVKTAFGLGSLNN